MQYEDHRPKVASLRRERMRLRLIEGALTLVAQKGVSATSIDDVISAAQVSRGTFYKYFESPTSLVQTVAQEIANEVMKLIDPIVLKHDNPAVRVATGVRLALRLARQNPVIGAFLLRLGWPIVAPNQLMLIFLPRDLLLGMQQDQFFHMEISAAVNLTLGAVLGGIHTILTPGAPESFPEQAAMSVLMGLGVEQKMAHQIAYAKLKALAMDGNGLLARSLEHMKEASV